MSALRCVCAVVAISLCSALATGGSAEENGLPPFGLDTVLVWEMRNQDFNENFVVRIAEFLPDRYVEWEDANTQGTIFMPNRDIVNAKGFVNANLFQSGMDTRGKDATTLWLSQRIYRELKAKGKAKCNLDGVSGWLINQGSDHLAVEVNRAPVVLPVLKVKDDRGGERWFLDHDENPLMLKHTVRTFTQLLASITTNRPNSLRWIKGTKLAHPPMR